MSLLQSYKEAILHAPDQLEVEARILDAHWHRELMNDWPINDYDMRSIALTMIRDMEVMLQEEGITDKFNRWLGFLQGILWCTQLRTINEMRDENRPIFKPEVRDEFTE